MSASKKETVRVSRYTFSYTDLNAAGDGIAFETLTFPANSTILSFCMRPITPFLGDGDHASVISFGLNDAADTFFTASDLSVWNDPQWGTAGVYSDVESTVIVIWTAAGTDTALTAGSMEIITTWICLD